jgi:hypothetical protein
LVVSCEIPQYITQDDKGGRKDKETRKKGEYKKKEENSGMEIKDSIWTNFCPVEFGSPLW